MRTKCIRKVVAATTLLGTAELLADENAAVLLLLVVLLVTGGRPMTCSHSTRKGSRPAATTPSYDTRWSASSLHGVGQGEATVTRGRHVAGHRSERLAAWWTEVV